MSKKIIIAISILIVVIIGCTIAIIVTITSTKEKQKEGVGSAGISLKEFNELRTGDDYWHLLTVVGCEVNSDTIILSDEYAVDGTNMRIYRIEGENGGYAIITTAYDFGNYKITKKENFDLK